MENLKKLFESGNYEEIVKKTKGSSDPLSILFKILSFVSLGRDDEALDEIEKSRDILEKKYPEKLIKIHFELLLKNRLFDEAKLAWKHYEELPYISQEVEELLREFPKQIEEAKSISQTNAYSEEEIERILTKSIDNNEISELLFSLKKYNLNLYIDALLKFIKRSDVHPNFRTYGLILLVDNKYDANISFLLMGKIINVNPSKINPPFLDKTYNLLTEKIYFLTTKDISLQEISLHLLNCYIIDTYPNEIKYSNLDNLAKTFVSIGKDYLSQKDSIDPEVLEIKNNVKKVIESTPNIEV